MSVLQKTHLQNVLRNESCSFINLIDLGWLTGPKRLEGKRLKQMSLKGCGGKWPWNIYGIKSSACNTRMREATKYYIHHSLSPSPELILRSTENVGVLTT
jgi:hypothetical protein